MIHRWIGNPQRRGHLKLRWMESGMQKRICSCIKNALGNGNITFVFIIFHVLFVFKMYTKWASWFGMIEPGHHSYQVFVFFDTQNKVIKNHTTERRKKSKGVTIRETLLYVQITEKMTSSFYCVLFFLDFVSAFWCWLFFVFSLCHGWYCSCVWLYTRILFHDCLSV